MIYDSILKDMKNNYDKKLTSHYLSLNRLNLSIINFMLIEYNSFLAKKLIRWFVMQIFEHGDMELIKSFINYNNKTTHENYLKRSFSALELLLILFELKSELTKKLTDEILKNPKLKFLIRDSLDLIQSSTELRSLINRQEFIYDVIYHVSNYSGTELMEHIKKLI